MTREEFITEWNLYVDGGKIFDEDGNEIAEVCSDCGKVEPSAATCNCGRRQPDYCRC